MTAPIATLDQTILTTHRLAGIVLLVLTFAIAMISIVARSQPLQLSRALLMAKLASPVLGLVVLTGAYLMLAGDARILQGWLIAGLALAGAYVVGLYVLWRPRAEAILARAPATSGVETNVADGPARELLAGLGVALVAIVTAAIWLMEKQPG